MTTKPKKTVSQEKTALLPTPVANVELVPLSLIDVLPQIRTEFDNNSLHELAQDIQLHGLLQPVLLNPNLNRFTLIAGERRLRAYRLLGLASIPALITKASAADAEDLQLAENIQREELGLEDLAHAVRRLFDRLGSLQAVADQVKKSKPWVSKHLSMSCNNFGWQAKQLLEDGISEDLELLTLVSKLAREDYFECDKLFKAIKAKKAGRKEAQAALKAAKEKKKKARAAQSTATVTKPKQPKAPPTPILEDLIDTLQDWLCDENDVHINGIKTEFAPLWNELDSLLTSWWSAGVTTRDRGIEAVAINCFAWSAPKWLWNQLDHPGSIIEHGAWLRGVSGRPYDIEEILQATKDLVGRLQAQNDAGNQVADAQPEASA